MCNPKESDITCERKQFTRIELIVVIGRRCTRAPEIIRESAFQCEMLLLSQNKGLKRMIVKGIAHIAYLGDTAVAYI